MKKLPKMFKVPVINLKVYSNYKFVKFNKVQRTLRGFVIN